MLMIRNAKTDKYKFDMDSQTQLSACFLLVITRTLPVARSIGIAQQTIRGVKRFFVVLMLGKLGTIIVERDESQGRVCKKLNSWIEADGAGKNGDF